MLGLIPSRLIKQLFNNKYNVSRSPYECFFLNIFSESIKPLSKMTNEFEKTTAFLIAEK